MTPNDPTSTPPSTPSGIQFEELRPPPIPDHELIRCIGQGSYGEVWLARNVMGTYRAVKIVHRRSFVDERPFDREYNGIQRFEPVSRSHESQVDILHIGRHNGCFFYVMELADDQDRGQEIDPDSYAPKNLRTVVERQGRLSADESVEIALALTTALEHLHSHGLVHRDIKPSNIIFVHGIPKLADIGLVTSADATRSFVGTEGFLPPEGPGTARADIYSLGKVLYELCTGRDRKDYPELPTLLDELEDRERLLELNAIIAKACREDARERYGSAEAMRQDLLLMQSGKSVRRMQRLEKRLAQLSRIGVAALLVSGLALGAYLFQRHQTAEASRLAEVNQQLATQSREQLLRLRVANGARLMEEGNLASSLLWFADAMELVEGNSAEEAIHRLRFEQVWNRMPRLHRMFRHDAKVNTCQFSPDGRRLVTASDDGTARVWDIEGDAPVNPPLQHNELVLSARFCHEGSLVLTASRDGTARLWHAQDGSSAGGPFKHDSWVLDAMFHPANDRVLTFGLDNTARLWEITTSQLLHEFAHDNVVFAAGFNPDGRLLATGDGDGKCRIWATESGVLLGETEHAGPVSSIHFGPLGRRLFVGAGSVSGSWEGLRGQGTVLDPETGEVLARMIGHPDGISSAAISSDGRWVATGSDKEARLWRLDTGQQWGQPLDHGSLVRHVEFSPDGRWMVTACEDGRAGIFHALTGEAVFPWIEQGAWVYHAAFSPDGTQLATASDNSFVKVWDLTSGPKVAYSYDDPSLHGARLHESDLKTFWFDDNRVEVRASQTQEILLSVQPGGPVYAAHAEKGENRLFLWFHDEKAEVDRFQLRALDSGEDMTPEWQSALDVQRARAVWIGSHLIGAFGEDPRTVQIADLRTGEAVVPELVFDSQIMAMDSCRTGTRLVVGLYDGQVYVYDIESGQRLYSIRHDRDVHAVEFSPDNRWLLTTSADQTGRIWDLETGEPRTPPFKHGGRVRGGAWSPDGARVLTYGLSPVLYVWNSMTGERALPGMDHGEAVLDASFSPDNRFIAAASMGGRVRVWDAATGESVLPTLEHRRGVGQLRFTENGSGLCVVTATGVQMWELAPANRELSTAAYQDVSRLHAAQFIESTGNIGGLPAEPLWAAYRHIKVTHPELFIISRRDRIDWHSLQLTRSRWEFNPFAAKFHGARLQAHQVINGEEELELLIQAMEIPPRSTAVKTSAIDLTAAYNMPLTSAWNPILGFHGFSDLLPGILSLDGLEFDVRGIVQLRGVLSPGIGHFLGAEPLIRMLPEQLNTIPVRAMARRLHFIHAAAHNGMPKGIKLGHYTIRYIGGLEVEFPFHQGQDLADWWDPPDKFQGDDAPVIGWEGHTSLTDGQQQPVRLYLSTWENPLPHLEIESFDFVSAMERALPFLVAVTAEPPDELAPENESLEHGQLSRTHRGAESDERLVLADGQEAFSQFSR